MTTELSPVFLLFILYVIAIYSSDACVCLKSCLNSLQQPIYMEQSKVGTQRTYYVAEQRGVVSRYDSSWNNREIFLDLSAKVAYDVNSVMDERGLLGFALHPNFEINKKIYTYSIRQFNSKDYAYVTELQEGTGKVKNSMEKVLFVIDQPYGKRNGGQLLFGADGFLYVMVGDGGVQQNDVDANATQAQNASSFLGSILRIDVNGKQIVGNMLKSYAIPPDNPSSNTNFSNWRPELFAIGFRNPWRCSIDKADGKMFCGDLGGNTEEEIDIVHKGGNYGWNIWEGKQCVSPSDCVKEDFVDPIHSYRHPPHGGAVVGGYVYRGSKLKNLIGQYLFADILTSNISSLYQVNGSWKANDVRFCDKSQCPCGSRNVPDKYILSFGQDNDGELYLLTTSNLHGKTSKDHIFQLVPPVEGSASVTCGADGMRKSALILVMSLHLLNVLVTTLIIRT